MSSQKLRKYNFIVLLFSILLSLYLCEGYLSFLKYKNSLESRVKIYEKVTGKKYDTRSLLEVYTSEKKNKEIALRYSPKILLERRDDEIGNMNLFPLSGISNIKTIFCNEEGFYSSYVSDRYGFNNPDEVWNQDEIDTIIIGDSFVHGMCVNRPDDIPSVIRNLTKKNIISLGYRGNGPLIEYATLREYLNKPVKNIIWVYYENDLIDLHNELKNEILRNYIENSHKDIFESKQLRLIIATNKKNQPIGCIDLFDFEPKHKRVGVGIIISKLDERNKGYALTAIQMIVKYAFTHLNLHQLYANITEDNSASIKLFENSKFKLTGIKKDWIFSNKGFKNESIYQLINE